MTLIHQLAHSEQRRSRKEPGFTLLGVSSQGHGLLAWFFLWRHRGHNVVHMSDWRCCGYMCKTCPGHPISSG